MHARNGSTCVNFMNWFVPTAAADVLSVESRENDLVRVFKD